MELSISILEESLCFRGFSLEQTAEFSCSVQGASYFSPAELKDTSRKRQRILVIDHENLEVFLNHLTDFHSWLLVAAPACREQLEHRDEIQSLLLWPDGWDARRTLEAIVDLFAAFSAWRESVLLQIIEQRDIQTIVDTLSEVAANPFSVLDNNSFILARTKGYETLPAGTIWDHMRGSYLNVFDFYTTAEWASIRRRIRGAPNAPVLLRPEGDPAHTYYMCSIQIDGKPNGSIGSLDIFAPFTRGQVAIMEIIRSLLAVYLHTKYRAAASHGFLSNSLHAFLERTPVEESELSALLEQQRWQRSDTFYLLTFRYPVILNTEPELASYVNILQMQFPKAAAAILHPTIVLLLRAGECPLHKEAFREKTQAFLARSGMVCGYSHPFFRFEDAPHHLTQTRFAADEAVRMEQSLVSYADVQAQHLLKLLGRHAELSYLIHPQIAAWMNSSKRSDRALVECLHAYLLNGRSISAAARTLDLHRNTVIYRLQRIQELLHTDLDALTGPVFFSLLFSTVAALETAGASR